MALKPYRPGGLPQIDGGDKPFLQGELTKIADSLQTAKEDQEALDTLLTFPTDTLFGRDAASAGAPEYITVGGGIAFTGAGALQTSAFTGDVAKAAGGTALTIANDAVTYAKMQNVSATSRFLGRITTGAGDTEELTGTQATTLLNAFTSSLKGLVPASGGGTTNFLRADGAWSAITVPLAASTADEETATSTTVFTSPGTQHRHPSAAKAWVKFSSAGTILASYNVSGITHHGAGAYTITFTNAFSSANFVGLVSVTLSTPGGGLVIPAMDFNSNAGAAVAPTASTQTFSCFTIGSAANEPVTCYYAAFGDQ